jgi:YjbE family integral membrane protein
MEIALDNPAFWIAVLQIIAIDILLGGDNAVVIALACRNLPPEHRRKGIFWGVAGAIGLRVVLTIFAVTLLTVPYLKIIGAVLLLWIGIKLVLPEHDEGHEIEASTKLLGAIKTIIVADAVMSLDNVIAVAAAAKDSYALIVFGLLVSIPIIVYASQLVLKLMGRFPWIVVLGGGLLGWIGMGMAVHDYAVKDWVAANAAWLDYAAPVAGALFVMGTGKLIAMRSERRREARVVDLAAGGDKGQQ